MPTLLMDENIDGYADYLSQLLFSPDWQEISSTPQSLPVFTISDINRFRSDRGYMEALVVKLLEYLFDADNILGTGRLYLP